MLLAAAAGDAVAQADPEATLAQALAARDAVEKVLHAANLPPAQLAARQDWLLRQYPASEQALDVQAERARAHFQAERWPECISAADAVLAGDPTFGALHGEMAYLLARVAMHKGLPDDVQHTALQTLARHSRHCSWVLMLTRQSLLASRLSPAEKYRLARQGEEKCGRYPYARQYAWSILEAYARAAAPQEAIAECQRFLDRWGAEAAESIAARQLLLQTRQKNGDTAAGAELKRLQEEEKRLAAEAKTLRDTCDEALKAGRAEQAVAGLESFRRLPPRSVESAWWLAVLKQLATQASPELQLRAYGTAIDCLPLGQAAEEVYKLLSESPLRTRPEAVDLELRWLARNAHDRVRDRHRCTALPRQLEASDAPIAIQCKALAATAEIARKLEMHDIEAQLLWKLAVQCWDTDAAAARTALGRAATCCNGSLSGAKARWLLAFLEGQASIAQGPLPREPSCLAEDSRTATALPAAPPVQPDVVPAGDGWQLRKFDPGENLADWQHARQSPGAWIVPLARVATVSRVVLDTVEQTQVLISLLDSSGRVLARYERSWNFWEEFRTAQLWAPASLELHVLPVPGVAYVRVDLLDVLGNTGRVRKLAVYSPPYPAVGEYLLPPAPIAERATAVNVAWTCEEPQAEVVHRPDLESVRLYPVMRWATPWNKGRGPLPMQPSGRCLGIEFYGRSAVLVVQREGKAAWSIDGGHAGVIEHPAKESSEYLLAERLAPHRHLLTIENQALPAHNDQFGSDGLALAGLKVKGQSCVQVAIRFGAADRWTPWTTLTQSAAGAIAVPDAVADTRPAQYQLRLKFDSREVLAEQTATVAHVAVTPANRAAVESVPASPAAGVADQRSFFRDEPAEVASRVVARQVVVAYPKTGSRREYAAAKRIAERAGLYLVSDDIGLNLYPGLVLSVGRPQVHRYARQLLGMKQVWNDPEFLNRTDGVVGVVRDLAGKPSYLFVTGETVAAVENAAQRLLARTPECPQPREPFRLFASDTLEMVYPWQLSPERPEARELALRLGRNDRRSVQLGISAAERLEKLQIECSPLQSSDGHTLPTALVRPVGCYEWVPFFGDLRLPNLLLTDAAVTLPANTAMGVWLTVLTRENSPPGLYTGKLTISAAGSRQAVPVQVVVEPVTLPHFARAKTYSFAGVPYWFHSGTAACERALRELARDEAAQGVSVVQPRFLMDVSYPASKNPYPFVLDFRELDRQLEIFEQEYRMLGRPLPAFLCQSPPLYQINKELFGEPGSFPATAARLFAQQFAAHLKATGRADRFYMKISDEPADIALWASFARPFHEGGLRTMTCHAAHYPNIDVAAGLMDPWCPNYQHDLWRPFFRERQQRGESFWWYCCGVPSTRLTGTPIDNLPFYWLTAKWHLDGAINYAALHTSDFSMPVPFRYEHGMDHRMVFLADGTLYETTRRELEGDGIRDLKLIELVRERAAAIRKQGDTGRAEQLDKALADVIEAVVPYRYGYASTPEAWHHARATLYDLLTH
jgi:hypothetical protein